MKKFMCGIVLAMSFVACGPPGAALVGTWNSVGDVNGNPLELRHQFSSGTDTGGAFQASLISTNTASKCKVTSTAVGTYTATSTSYTATVNSGTDETTGCTATADNKASAALSSTDLEFYRKLFAGEATYSVSGDVLTVKLAGKDSGTFNRVK